MTYQPKTGQRCTCKRGLNQGGAMRQETVNIYTYDELSDRAKERAKEWFRVGNLAYEWWDSTYEDAERIGLTITEFDLGGRKHIKGQLNTSVQECCESILREHGKTCDTYKLAKIWIAKSEALSEAIEALDDEEAENERNRLEAEQDENYDEFLHALLEEYFILLDHEAEYLQSDESVEESIRANECEFDEDGEVV